MKRLSYIILKYSENVQEIAEIYQCLVIVGWSHKLIYLHKQDSGFPEPHASTQ